MNFQLKKKTKIKTKKLHFFYQSIHNTLQYLYKWGVEQVEATKARVAKQRIQ